MTEKEQTLYDVFNFKVNDINYLINISDKYKYIYFETPKVGCSTIKRTLQKLEVDNLSEIPEDVHNKGLSPLLSPLQLEKNFTKYLNDEYFKFTFVRNPYTRILSCYLDKMVTDQDEKKRLLPELGFEPTDKLSFKEFLLAIKKQTYAEMDVHWKPQSILLAADNITLDFIGRQEDFDNDLKKVLAKITKDDSDLLQISNERPHAVGANKKIQQYITEDIAKLIQEIYYDDFYLYGYSTDPFNTDPLPNLSEHLIENTSTSNELVSIIIPCYNQAEYLEEAVQSVIEQTYPNVEIIIVNDGSLDNTKKVALTLQEKYPEKIKIVSQKNQGLSQARNNGILEASGNYILPLDADDLIHKDMILKCLETLEKYNADIVYADTVGFGIRNYTLKWKPFSETNPLYVTTSNATALYKKKVWEVIGGYKVNMKGGYEDWEFWINAYKHDFLFQHHSEILFYYRQKEEGMYTQTLQKESYHRAKMILNHPEMYIYEHVQEAISTVKVIEKSADYYFYSNKKEIPNEKELMSDLFAYIQKNSLQPELILNILNTKIMLCEITEFSNHDFINNMQHKIGIDIFLFYSPLRYDIPILTKRPYAYYHDQEPRLANGTVFPFVARSSNDKHELTAYKQLTKYVVTTLKQKDKSLREKDQKLQEMIVKKDEQIAERQEVLNQRNKQLAERQEVLNQRNKQLEERQEVLNQRNKQLEEKHKILKEMQVQLTLKDKVLQEMIVKKDEQIAERQKVLNQRNKQLEDKHKILKEIQVQLDKTNYELGNIKSKIDDFNITSILKNPIKKLVLLKNLLKLYQGKQ